MHKNITSEYHIVLDTFNHIYFPLSLSPPFLPLPKHKDETCIEMMDHQVYPPSTECIIRNITPGPTTGIWTYCRDYHSQQPKGFAFIEYATPEMAREAREEMNKFLMKGRELEVVYAQEKRKTPNEMRGRVVDGKFEAGNGGGHGGGGRRGGNGGGRGGRGGGEEFQRSSSFERMKSREQEGKSYFRPEDRRD